MGDADGPAHSAFESMASVYDLFAADYEYEPWLRDLVTELEGHGLHEGRLLDVACGTGKSFLPMLESGWEVTGCDFSASMLRRAEEKAPSAHLAVADMRELPTFGRFDLVWCLGNSLNYLSDGEELRAALTGMRRNLAADGLLMFDLGTLLALRTFYAETSVREQDGQRLVWVGHATPDLAPGSTGEATLSVEGDSGQRLEPMVHRQRHFPAGEAREVLASAGLQCLDTFGHHFDGVFKRPLDEAEHTTAVYIARIAR